MLGQSTLEQAVVLIPRRGRWERLKRFESIYSLIVYWTLTPGQNHWDVIIALQIKYALCRAQKSEVLHIILVFSTLHHIIRNRFMDRLNFYVSVVLIADQDTLYLYFQASSYVWYSVTFLLLDK